MKIKKARNDKKLSQEAVSRIIDVSLRHYQDIEKGVVMPSVIIALALCEIFQIDIKEVEEWQDWKKRIEKK